MRGSIYIDGFNLYHAVDDLRRGSQVSKSHLKWLNLWKLGELLARGHAKSIERAVFCTAFFPGDHGKKARHQAYIDALANVGVETILGHTTKEPMECRSNVCGHRWDQPREKETDINLALSIYEDALSDLYDVAFVVTADTDQAGTYRALRRNCPGKKIITVFPPGRNPSKHLKDLSDATISLKEKHIDECALPAMVMKQGARTIIRPAEYTPPDDWVHPDDRPK